MSSATLTGRAPSQSGPSSVNGAGYNCGLPQGRPRLSGVLDAANRIRPALPILFGLEKFFDVLVNWEIDLAPWINDIIPGTAAEAMYAVGVIEIPRRHRGGAEAPLRGLRGRRLARRDHH